MYASGVCVLCVSVCVVVLCYETGRRVITQKCLWNVIRILNWMVLQSGLEKITNRRRAKISFKKKIMETDLHIHKMPNVTATTWWISLNRRTLQIWRSLFARYVDESLWYKGEMHGVYSKRLCLALYWNCCVPTGRLNVYCNRHKIVTDQNSVLKLVKRLVVFWMVTGNNYIY